MVVYLEVTVRTPSGESNQDNLFIVFLGIQEKTGPTL